MTGELGRPMIGSVKDWVTSSKWRLGFVVAGLLLTLYLVAWLLLIAYDIAFGGGGA